MRKLQTTSYREGWSRKVGVELRDNVNAAYKRVKSNKGSHGVDGMKEDELLPYLKQDGKALIASILEGTYRPKPVRRVEIENPEGGIRLLGIPTVVDRPWRRKFLGFTFYQWYGKIGIRVHEKSINRFKNKVREITSRSNAWDMEYRMRRLRQVITGWLNYFSIADISRLAKELDEWVRRKIECAFGNNGRRLRLSMII
jgi:hypothetical protein